MEDAHEGGPHAQTRLVCYFYLHTQEGVHEPGMMPSSLSAAEVTHGMCVS